MSENVPKSSGVGESYLCESLGSHGETMKIIVFRDLKPCSPVDR
jgi:hypothetical protein